ncbi:hypothetical protein V1264_019220 [Littorina saxatilis]|uniref:Bulb-type lectin domain-containing protein n=1 Tax=Littorina saxatilis TaxID=31220 RepID=A0AAN9BG36_9CAEN
MTSLRSVPLLVALLTVLVTEVTGRVRWTMQEGALVSMSVGRAGVWGVNRDDKIYYREDTYGEPMNEGADWNLVDGSLVQLDVGNKIVWGVNTDDRVYYRSGITGKR